MKRLFVSICLVLFINSCLLSQTVLLDSLKTSINLATSDTSKTHRTIEYAAELLYTNTSESQKLLEECIIESRKNRDKKGEANALNAMAISLGLEGKYEASLKYLIESSNIYKQIGNKIGYAKCIGGQGNIYYFINDFLKAQDYYEQALQIYREENYTIGIASCISNLGVACHRLGKYEKSLEYQIEGLRLEEMAENKRGIAISHISISGVLLNLKRFSEAKKHALLSIQISKAIADSNATSDGLLRLAECYRIVGQFDSAQYYLDETIRMCEKIKALGQLAYALETQIILYDSLRHFENAYKTQKRLLLIKDSLLNREKTAQLVEMQTKFETEKKVSENEILKSKNFNQKLILWGMLLIIALAFVLTLHIFLSRKKLLLSHENLIILHQKVRQHKEEIETQAENLSRANEAIILQKDQIEQAHQKTSDSIIYASFIQAAMLPPGEMLNRFFSENFILYEPRDVVSGDFYWFKEKEGNFFIAVADCTGHGVPGALLSMMGISFLNDIVANSNKIKTSYVLEDLRHNVKLALGQFSNRSLRKEGIEIGLIHYNQEQQIISFSGAYLSLWLCRNGVIKEYKSDKMPIGISLKEKPFTYTELKIEKGDTIYMFTDGFADQIGGPNGKKLLRRNLLNEITKISSLPLVEQKKILEQIHRDWKGERYDQIDDILVMGIKLVC